MRQAARLSRPIVNPQQIPVFTPGQGKKAEKGERFRECTNRRDIRRGKGTTDASTMAG
jgi:hypothetical protein